MEMPKTQQEVVRQGYQILVESLGVADAIRFIQHFSAGHGDYTQERHTWLDQASLEEILSDMKQPQASDAAQHDEMIG
jgi:hypothetical protein